MVADLFTSFGLENLIKSPKAYTGLSAFPLIELTFMSYKEVLNFEISYPYLISG